MWKYVLLSLSFIIAILILFGIHFNDKSVLLDEFILMIIAPFLIFALISAIMGNAMRKRNTGIDSSFQRPFRNLQLFLSGIYLVILIYSFNLLSLKNRSIDEDCTDSNLMILSDDNFFKSDSVKRYNIMAYQSLKSILTKVSGRESDTSICITALQYQPVDTVINDHQMKAKIIMELTIAQRDKKFYRYMYYCNDSVGFGIDKFPQAKF